MSVSPLAHNGYSYVPFIAKSKAACGLCFHQLGGHIELPFGLCASMTSSKYITYRNAPEEDQATAIGNMHKNW